MPQPADAIVACTSLHHIADLGTALDLVEAALIPGGRLVIVEWAWERFDAPTARWCFDRLPSTGTDPGWRCRFLIPRRRGKRVPSVWRPQLRNAPGQNDIFWIMFHEVQLSPAASRTRSLSRRLALPRPREQTARIKAVPSQRGRELPGSDRSQLAAGQQRAPANPPDEPALSSGLCR